MLLGVGRFGRCSREVVCETTTVALRVQARTLDTLVDGGAGTDEGEASEHQIGPGYRCHHRPVVD
ncbi:MAG: hypothetical protein M3Y06_05990, partial [Actinomycetota bacterium]|nr:hypothetical protein [Actinomycetota bacterium]